MNVLYIPISNNRFVKEREREREREREEKKRKDEKIPKLRRLKAKFPRISYLDAGKGYWTDSGFRQSFVYVRKRPHSFKQ